MHPAAHALRTKIAGGRPVLGTFVVELAGPAVVHVLARAGFDFLLVDGEHGNFDPRQVEALVEAGWHAGVCVIVRPPTAGRGLITRALDAGAGGVLIPAVDSLAQVRRAVQASKYRPLGRRGVHLLRGHTRHQRVEPAAFMAEANRDLLTLIQIELESAIELVEPIAAMPGVDGLYVGPGDLSADLGVPGQWEHPRVQGAIRRVAAACAAHGKIAACHADRIDRTPALRELGVQVLGYFCDIGMLARAAEATTAEFRAAMEAPALAKGSPPEVVVSPN